jgi:hypothetical protein
MPAEQFNPHEISTHVMRCALTVQPADANSTNSVLLPSLRVDELKLEQKYIVHDALWVHMTACRC